MGTILNELDGVNENYGRILIITANDISKFDKVEGTKALFRAGRIDVKVELGNSSSSISFTHLHQILTTGILRKSFLNARLSVAIKRLC